MGALKQLLSRLRDSYRELREMGPGGFITMLRGQPRYWFRILRHTFRLFMDNRGPYQANTLAYRTLLSLVPMLAFTISFSLMMHINVTQDLRQLLVKYFLPPEMAPQPAPVLPPGAEPVPLDGSTLGAIQPRDPDHKKGADFISQLFDLIDQFQQQAEKATVIGFFVLLMASIFLINAIEMTFNNIWHVRKRRPYAWRILSYTAMTVFIPMALGLSIYMTAQLQVENVSVAISDNILGQYIPPLIHWTWRLIFDFGMPLAVVWLLFVAMYKWLPNTRVETKAALITGIIVAVAFEMMKWGFSIFAARMVLSRQVWWGSLGVFLVFLVWVYMIWWLVLFGAQLLYVYQNYRYVFLKGHTLEGRVGEAYLALRIMLAVSMRHYQGETGPTVRELAERMEVDVPRIQEVLDRLMDAGLLMMAGSPRNGGSEEEVYLPGRDIGTITLAEVISRATNFWEMRPDRQLIEIEESEPKLPGEVEGSEQALDRLILKSRGQLEDTLGVSFRDLIASEQAEL